MTTHLIWRGATVSLLRVYSNYDTRCKVTPHLWDGVLKQHVKFLVRIVSRSAPADIWIVVPRGSQTHYGPHADTRRPVPQQES